jgi:neutral ceramidase
MEPATRHVSCQGNPALVVARGVGRRLDWALVVALLALAPEGWAIEAGWHAGVASVCITPSQPMWLAGYPASRSKPYEQVTLDIFAKALVLEDAAGRRSAIVTLDLHGITRRLRDAIETRARERCHIEPAALLLNASHTHCGPEIRDPLIARPELGGERVRLAARYRAELVEKVLATIGRAVAALAPATVSYGLGRAGFAMNRRADYSLRPGDPNYELAPNPWGPVDHEVPVLQVADRDGRDRALLFGYACHNTTLNGYQVNADYAGYAQRFVEETHPGAVALFLTGCAGDQTPHPRRTAEWAVHHGRSLAHAVEAALNSPRVAVAPAVRTAMTYVDLQYAPPPTAAELELRLGAKGYFLADHARLLLARLHRGEPLPTSYPCPIQVMRLGGELILVALGGEVVVDYSLRLKREIVGAKVWVAGYSNDVFTYVPSERVLAEGGYEGGRCMRYTETQGLNPGPWQPGLEDQIIGEVHRLVRQTGHQAMH